MTNKEASSEFPGIAGSSPDIRDRVGLEQALRLSEQRYRLAISGSPVVVWECDRDLRYTFMDNPQPPVTNPAQFIGKRDEEILPFDSVRELLEIKNRVLATGVGERREISLPAADKMFHFEMVVEPIYDSDRMIAGLRGLAIDISERKRTEEILRSVSAELRQTLHIAATGLTHCSRDLRYLSANPAYAQYVGQPLGQIVGRPIAEVMGKDAFEIIRPRIERVLRGETVQYEDEVPIGGVSKCIRVAYTPDRDASGNVVGWVASIMEITERKRAEETLRRSDERQAFLLKLSDALRPLGNPLDVQEVAARLLGEHLRSNRVGYAEIDGRDYVIRREYASGVRPLVGEGPVGTFGVALRDAYRNGETVVVNDVSTDPRFTEAERTIMQARQIAAYVGVTLIKGGRLVAAFGANNATPRVWTSIEVALIREVAERTWEAIERARAEGGLREREQRLRLALDASGGGSWTWDARTNRVDWDDHFRKLYGFTPEEPPAFETWLTRVHEKDRPLVLGLLDEIQRTKARGGWDNTFSIVRPDGTESWIQSLGRANRDATGQVTRLTGLELDITERKRHEANFAFSADVTAVLSQLSRVDEIMQAFGARIAGFLKVSSVTYWDIDEGRNEARLHSIWAASHASALPSFVRLADYSTDAFARDMRAGETTVICDTEMDPRVNSSACRAINLRAAIIVVPFLQEGKWRFALNLFDSNPRDWREDEIELVEELANRIFPRLERARAEEALRVSEERYRGLAEQVSDGIFATDSQGRYVDANRAGCEMFGYTLEELKTLTVRDVIPLDELHRLPEQFQRLSSGQVVRNDWRFRRKDGSVFIGELVCSQSSDGRLRGIVRDITERKTAEAVLRDEARSKDEFLAVLGHELRNPLAAISISMQVLSAGVTADRRARMEEAMGRQVTLMRRLLDDLLDLGRIKYGHIELMKERIDLAEFLQKATSSLQPAIASRRQELLLRLPSESVQFMADRIRLEQIATNLLSNASKYTAPGGRIELSGAREGSEVVLHCKDNGQGVLPEDQEKIFEPFTRGRKTQDSHGEASLGIGLALAKQLTELHGGTVSVESAGAEMGSDFIVRLPLAAPPSDKPVTAEPNHALPSRRGRSIVLVEDNPDIAEGMEVALEQAGLSVRIFPDGPSALAGVAELKPDAVLLDIGLPGMDGYELAVELKKQTNMRDALFIALSGFKPREQAGQVGGDFDHYFTKPVDVQALLALLDTNGKRREPK